LFLANFSSTALALILVAGLLLIGGEFPVTAAAGYFLSVAL
jgi:hypothetical protein